ncbi:uncharacterized protein C1orf50 homolog [Ceratina calcarata]|uniref:Uncharacterized protein C1orf50 homolog n=1 Tax=Ceratina calcarata TaxID=156304 RepID=A0AAJ7J0Z3_9HYME|nr:uncharacterized protein C1orf50 homolog [Ceratina calcarata]XP_017881450.1 uncharacterized protein C1orf50 homolog [Ceratina calcarata]
MERDDLGAVAKIPKQDLVALAKEIEKADSFVKSNACGKLQVIVEQIRFLKKQAENVLTEADWNMRLHHVACNFVKRPGHVYHLYQRETGEDYFSLISPEEWGDSSPTYKGSYRLEHDRSWTSLKETKEKDKDLAMLAKIWSNIPNSELKSIDLNLTNDNM